MAFPASPTHWQLRTRRLELPHAGSVLRRPLLMGIVNVTPDSFSDGGRHDSVDAAVAHGLQLVADGAEIINDVTGLEGDPDMLDVARESGAGICAMHMRGTPQTMQDDPRYDDVVTEIHSYLAARRDALLAAGIPLERICLDPGIGFGKTHAHNRELMAQAARFLDLGTPILVGHSRKGFIGKAIEQAFGRPATRDELDAATAQMTCDLAAAGIQIVRVHAVARVRAALQQSATIGP